MNASKGLSYELLGIIVMDGEKRESYKRAACCRRWKRSDRILLEGASLDEVIVAAEDPQKKEILEILDLLSQMGVTIHCRIPIPELSGAHQKALRHSSDGFIR